MRWRNPKWLLILFIVCLLLGCSAESQEVTDADISVQVVVTENFGAEILVDEVIEVSDGTSALKALRRLVEVGTAYGGGFIESINGIKSKYPKQEDWFIYLNGIATNKGAGQCRLYDGDVLHLDFHDWTFRTFIPAMIGHSTETFGNGFEGEVRPTIIVNDTDFNAVASELQIKIDAVGIANTTVRSLAELTKKEKQDSNLVIIGDAENELISELNHAWNKMGFFIHFEDTMIVVYDAKGEEKGRYGSGNGVIQMTQNPWNPKGIGVCENVVLIFTGIDDAGVTSAIDFFIENYDELEYTFAGVTGDSGFIKVP